MENKTHHIIEFPKLGITRYIPRQLKYCTTKEFRDIVGLLFLWQTDSISYHDFRVQAISLLLNLKGGKRKINNVELELMYSNISQISYCMDTFFTIEKDKPYLIKLDLIDNPVPYIKPFFKKIKGPKAVFTDTNFGQYEDAVNLFHRYHSSPDQKYLYQLLAIYYQNPKKYDNNKTENRALKIKRFVGFSEVYGFFLYFSSFQNYITSSKVLWESSVIDLSILFIATGNETKSNIPGLGTKGLGFQLAESGVFGTLKELRKENLWEVLLRLYDIRKRDLDQIAEAKRQETNKT